ncbi:MAG: SusC/RagA family TonB-linked outer membrane protein [Ferruginibacter sp.]
MRRFLSLFTVLMLSGVLAFAQSRVVTGTVTDNNGKPVPFASILVKGAGKGVQTNVNGEYSVKVNKGDVLVISQLNFETVEIPVGSMNSFSTSLELKTNTIKEVIVTSAFQTKRTLRSQSSNVQNVSAEALNTVRSADVNNALAGKVAGAQVRSQSGVSLGKETKIRLRGENSLTTSGSGPIYVVDGTIIPSSNDINTDDVEDITILQGPAAAALFGSDGANGAIVINTKKARKGQPGIGLEINTGVTFDKIYIVPDYQNAYAGGADGDFTKYNYQAGDPIGWQALDGKYYHDESDDASWGPRIAGQEYIPWYAWYGGSEYSYKTTKLTAHPNNVKDFYNTGITKTTNVNFSKAGDNYNFRVSYTNLDQKGLIPNEFMKRNTFNTNFAIDLTSKLTVGANVNYISQKRNSEDNDGYSNQSSGSFNQWFHRDNDMKIMKELRSLKTPEGIYASWNHQNPGSYDPASPVKFYGGNYWFNYYSYFDLIQNPDNRDRLFGDISLRYKINNDLSVKATYRKQQLNTDGYSIYPQELENSGTQTSFNPYEGSGKAVYGEFTSFSNRQNYELLVSYSKKIRDFAINANAGYDNLRTRARSYAANTVGGINVPGLYSLANSKDPITNSTRTDKLIEVVSNSQRKGLFIRADFGYRNFAFIEGTYRRDYSSTEPHGHYIDTKSIGGSFVFSDFIKNKSILSYGKIRASYGQILNSLGIYQINSTYKPDLSYNGNLKIGEPNTLIDPALQGAVNTEKEIGLETRWLKNRVGFSVTYWDRTNKKFPVTISIPGATGYPSLTTNAGEVAKTGVDVQLFAKPIKMKNFEWDVTATWGRLIKNQVVSIVEDTVQQRLVSASGAFSGTSSAYTVSAEGQAWGQMFGGGIKRDASGQPILTSDGLFIKQNDTYFGSVLPDYTGGVQSTFTLFKNFTVNINIDYQYGGKFFSLSDFWGSFSGLTSRTAVLNDKGNSIRDAVADGGGVHVTGVDDVTGKAIDYYVDAQSYFHQFRNANIAEASIYDLSFVKLREFSLGYKLPIERMGGVSRYIKNATFSVIARNPYLLWSKTKDFDPSEISGVQGEDGQFPGTRSLGINLKLGF